MNALVNKNSQDVSQILSAYILFSGDAAKTAVACEVTVEVVQALAHAEDWPSKVRNWTQLQEGDPRDLQIQINRAVNYVQAHRLRGVLDKIITKLHGMTTDELFDALTVATKHGQEFKTRALTDIVKAAESVQLMTQRALGDTAEERPSSATDGRGSRIMLDVAAAMQESQQLGIDSVELVKAQIRRESVKALPDADRGSSSKTS